MTERDAEYERWQLVLNSLQEVSAQYHQVVRSVQSGFGSLSNENAATARRLALIEAKVDRLDAALQKLLPDLAAIAAHAVRMQVVPKPRPARRVTNGE